jgi:hypothetical protein
VTKAKRPLFGGMSIERKSVLFTNEARSPCASRQMGLDTAFDELRHTIEYYPHRILEQTPTSLTISKFRTRTSWTTFRIFGDEREFAADCEDIIYSGSEAAMGHLLYYLACTSDSEVPHTPTPSYLPALILGRIYHGLCNQADMRALLAHGIGEAELETLRIKKWRDIHAASELWLEFGKDKTFAQMLRELGVL